MSNQSQSVNQIPKKETLIRVSQYVFRRESQALSEECQDSIVEMALYLSENKGLNAVEIKKYIESNFNFSNYRMFLISKSLDRLQNIKKVINIRGEKYFLKDERISEIDDIIKKRKFILEKFLTELINNLKKRYPSLSSEQIEKVNQVFYEFLASWFIIDSKFVTNILMSKEKIALIPQIPPTILEKSLKKIKPKKLRNALKKSVLELFSKLDREFVKFLFEMAQNFLYIELLNLDPEFRLLERSAFSRKTIILDTNFIMSLLLPSRPTHEVSKRILSISQSLGVNFAFTKRTRKEWINVLDKANERYKILKNTRPDILREINDDFIKSYFIETSSNSLSLTWEGFYLEMKRLEDRLKEYGVQYLYKKTYEKMKELYETELFEKVIEKTRHCAMSIAGNIKNKDVSEHDAYHLLLIRKLRESNQPDILGPQYWFLTYDTSLPCVDEAINEETLSYGEPPSSILAEIWLELIAPFLGPDVASKELPEMFADLMKTHFSVLPTGIDPTDLIEIMGPWLNYESLTAKDIQLILGDSLVQKYILKLKELKITKPLKAEDVRKTLFELVERKVSRILNEKLKSVKVEGKSLRSSLVWERKFWRGICGGFGTAFIFLSLLFFCTNNLSPAIIMAVIGIAMLLLALAFKFIRVKIGPIEIEAKE